MTTNNIYALEGVNLAVSIGATIVAASIIGSPVGVGGAVVIGAISYVCIRLIDEIARRSLKTDRLSPGVKSAILFTTTILSYSMAYLTSQKIIEYWGGYIVSRAPSVVALIVCSIATHIRLIDQAIFITPKAEKSPSITS